MNDPVNLDPASTPCASFVSAISGVDAQLYDLVGSLTVLVDRARVLPYVPDGDPLQAQVRVVSMLSSATSLRMQLQELMNSAESKQGLQDSIAASVRAGLSVTKKFIDDAGKNAVPFAPVPAEIQAHLDRAERLSASAEDLPLPTAPVEPSVPHPVPSKIEWHGPQY